MLRTRCLAPALSLAALVGLGLAAAPAARAQTYTVVYSLPAVSATGGTGTTLSIGAASGTTTFTSGSSGALISYGNITLGSLTGSVTTTRQDTFTITGGSLPAGGLVATLSDIASASVNGIYTLNDSGGANSTPAYTLSLLAPGATSRLGISGFAEQAALSLTIAATPEPSPFAALALGGFGLMGLTLRARQRRA